MTRAASSRVFCGPCLIVMIALAPSAWVVLLGAWALVTGSADGDPCAGDHRRGGQVGSAESARDAQIRRSDEARRWAWTCN